MEHISVGIKQLMGKLEKRNKQQELKEACNYRLIKGKHKGLTIREVATLDPGYLERLLHTKSTDEKLKKAIHTMMYGLLLGE